MTVSLYIHIPFCYAKCEYCDFYSVPLNTIHDTKIIENILKTITEELKYKLDMIPDPLIETIFIGGGTPSVINATLLQKFLNEINEITDGICSSDIEYTTEANIESCSKDFIKIISDAGINRLSTGVQSFDTKTLNELGRACYPENIYEAAEAVKKSWGNNLSFDLISGINMNYKDDIGKAVQLAPDHLSVYQLTTEENTEFHQKILNGEKKEPDEKTQIDSLNYANEYLKLAGYKRYEISNFARPGYECKHNLRYWNMQSYIGAGPSAVSSLYFQDRKVRYTNINNIDKYLASRDYKTEILTETDFLIEHFIMGCRLTDGIDPNIFSERFGILPETIIPQTTNRWIERGLMEGDGLRLNENGLLFLDAFLSDVYHELAVKN